MDIFTQLIIVTHLTLQLARITLISAFDNNDEDDSVENDENPEEKTVLREHYYAKDPEKVKKLAVLEGKLVSALTWTGVLDDLQDSTENEDNLCYHFLTEYLSGFHRDSKVTEKERLKTAYDRKRESNRHEGQEISTRVNIIAANPLLSYKLIRRIVVTLLVKIKRTCKTEYPKVLKVIERTFINEGLPPPTNDDLDDAIWAILKIHFIYGLHATNQLRFGILNGVHTGAVLSFQDCLAIADRALEEDMEVMAYQWLMSAVLASREQEAKVLEDEMDSVETAWDELKYVIGTRSIDVVHELLMNKRQDYLHRYDISYENEGPCRGELSESALKEQSKLFCYSIRKYPYFLIGPLKTEVLSLDPELFQFYEFLTPKQIAFVKNSTNKTAKRSMQMNGDFRVWNATFPQVLAQANQDPVVKLINYKIESVSGMKVFPKYASVFQMASYSPLGAHGNVEKLRRTFGAYNNQADETKGGVFLMFLSEAIMGGYQGFMKIGVFAKPEKGSALVWQSRGSDGEADKRLFQRSCPVILGYKEVANQVIG